MNFSLVFLLFFLLTSCGYKSDVDLVSETPAANTVETPTIGSYRETDVLTFTVAFNRIVTVSGTPCLKIILDSGEVCADYQGGSNSKELTFTYIIQSGDTDADGVTLGAIELNGGSIIDKRSREARLNYIVSEIPQIIISTSNAPLIRSVTTSYTTLKTSSIIRFYVEFDQDMFVGLGAVPRLKLNLDSGTAYAIYTGVSDKTLIFEYQVSPGEYDLNGITLDTTILNGHTIINFAQSYNANLSFTAIDTSMITVDGLDSVLTSITKPTDKYYKAGERLDFSLNFTTSVIVIGGVRVPLNIGGTTRYATYASGSGSNQINFSYTVVSGNEDHSGIEIGSIDLNSGSIKDVFGDNAILTHNTPTPNVKVDTIPPNITSLTVDSGTFGLGDTIGFNATFSEAVQADTSYYISFDVGGTSRQANYSSGNMTANLILNFEVPANDYDANGISINLAYSDPDMGTITDIAGNQLTDVAWPAPSLRPSTTIDARASVSSIDISNNTTAKTGSNIDFYVTFSRSVTVSGVPRLALNVGGITKYATYLSGSGSTRLLFRYTVQTNDLDEDGLELANSIDLNSGSILSGGVQVIPEFSAQNTSGLLVDGIDSSIISIGATTGNFKSGDEVNLLVTFSHKTVVTGPPSLPLTVGSISFNASYVSGSGTDSHTYRFTVNNTHLDLNGIDLNGTSLNLNSGTIKDVFGDNTNITFSAQNFPNTNVDGVAPTIMSVSGPSNNTYTLGQDLTFLVTYSEIVRLTGTPRLALTIGSSTVYANYIEGANSNILTFKYIITGDLSDTDGISLATTLDPNGASISDVYLNSQSDFTLTAPTLTGVLINSVAPTITGINGPLEGTYSYNENLSFNVTFSQAVSVTGTPVLDLDIGGSQLSASYVLGSGTNTLTFSYEISTTGLSDTDGVQARSLRMMAGSTIKNAIGADANLTVTPANFPTVLVDTSGPLLLSMTKPNDGVYKIGGTNTTLSFVATFSQIVNVTGTPRIALTVGPTTQYANYSSGTGSKNLTFSYSPASSHLDLDGISSSTSVGLNGGTIKNAGNTSQASLFFGNMNLTKVFVALSEMSHWYDLSDTNNLILSGNAVTSIRDKIGNYHFTHSTPGGVPYYSTGFRSTSYGYADCSRTSFFSLGLSKTSPTAGIFVYRAPAVDSLNAGSTQLMIGGTSSTQFRIDFRKINSSFSTQEGEIRAGAANPYAAYFSESLGWGTVGVPTNVMDFPEFWTRNGYATTGWRWNAPTSFDYRLCQFDGELAEVILFDSSVPSKDFTNEIGSYIFNRYGVSLTP